MKLFQFFQPFKVDDTFVCDDIAMQTQPFQVGEFGDVDQPFVGDLGETQG